MPGRGLTCGWEAILEEHPSYEQFGLPSDQSDCKTTAWNKLISGEAYLCQ